MKWKGRAVFGPLMAVAILSSCSDGDKVSVGEMMQKSATLALEGFKQDIGRYPTESEGLRALVVNPGIIGWHGPYLDRDSQVKDLSYRCADCSVPKVTYVRGQRLSSQR